VSEPMLELRSLRAGYGVGEVLRGVDLVVRTGSLTALLGRNGAGKTTTLRVVSGMLAPLAGEVLLEGQAIGGTPAEEVARLGVAHVPEGRGTLPTLTVRENLELGAHRRRAPRRTLRDDVERVTERFPRLRERMRQRAGSLSGGEQQMLSIARALMSEPRLLLVDEPSLGLAPLLVQELYEMLRSLADGGLTVLLVEQYVELALRTVDHAYVLEKGVVAVSGPARELRDDSDVVAAYLSA